MSDPFGEAIYTPSPRPRLRQRPPLPDMAGHTAPARPAPPESAPTPAPLPPPRNGGPGPALIPPPSPEDDTLDNLTAPDHLTAPAPREDAAPVPGQIDTGEAGALAAFFVASLLSWSEDDPERWSRLIRRDYLPDVDPRERGWWDGRGRQLVSLALPGRITRDTASSALVEVRARVIPYTRNPRAPHGPGPVGPPPPIGTQTVESTAPPPAAAGWRGHDAYDVRLLVPITIRPTGALAIDPNRVHMPPHGGPS